MRDYKHLVGLQFDWAKNDCYSLLKTFYKEQFNIHLPDFARPKRFWKYNLNLYGDNYYKLGFRVLDCHPIDWQYGDVFLMAIRSEVGNHVGVLVEDNKILHHMYGRLSTVEPYKGLWKNSTLNVYRHRDVDLASKLPEQHIYDYLSPRVRRLLDESQRET